MKVLIAAGGNADYGLLKEITSKDKYYIIGADRGLKYLYDCGIEPDMAIGDFDSLEKDSGAYDMLPENTVKLKPEKDFTDSHAALMEALRLEPEKVVLFAATGTRLDHTLANINILKICCDRGIEAEITDRNNRIRVIDKYFTMQRKDAFGKYVSFMSLGSMAESVTLEGFKYSVKDMDLHMGQSIGVSNEICSDTVTVSIGKGYLIMFETRD